MFSRRTCDDGESIGRSVELDTWSGSLDQDEVDMYLGATQNNNVQPPGFKNPIFFSGRGPFRRYDRIAALLGAGARFTRDDVRRIILDTHNTDPDETLPWFRGWTASTPGVERARVLLAAWDAEMRKESAAAALYFTWRNAVALDQLTALDASVRRPLIEAGLTKALATLTKAQGPDPTTWKWGAINRSAFPHPLVAAYDVPAVPRDGGGGSVHAIGSVYQLITDFSNLDESLVTIAPGESGQPGSPYYGNLLEAWSRRDAFRLAFSREAVEAHARNRLRLKPN
jgi:penicillin G amidase